MNIKKGDYVISTYQPAATAPLPQSTPLHAKECARALFDETLVQFVGAMLLEGLLSDKGVTEEGVDIDIDFCGEALRTIFII